MKKITINKGNYFTIKQKIGEFFVCKMTPKQLKEIVKEDLSRYSSLEEIQRDRDSKRLSKIRDYITKTSYATFPNSFIISVSNDSKINSDGDFEILSEGNDAYILDGQHRLYGFDEEDEEYETFEIIVSIYVGLSKFHQAMIFANINGEQVKVNKSLVYSLYGFGNDRSVENISYAIINGLNGDDASSLKGLIKILGKGDGTLSLAPFFEMLSSLLNDYNKDEIVKIIKNNIFDLEKQKELVGKMEVNILTKLYLLGEIEYKNDIFNLENKYKDDEIRLNEEKNKLSFFKEQDQIIYNKINTYYRVIATIFNEYWPENKDKNSIIIKTTGFYAFFKLFKNIVSDIIDVSDLDRLNEDFFIKIFELIKPNLKDLISSNYISGVKGQNDLYKDISKDLSVNKINELLSGKDNINIKNIADIFRKSIENNYGKGKKVTFKEALLGYGISLGEEKKFSEIVNQIVSKINSGEIYIDSKGKTPYDTLSAILTRDCSEFIERLPNNIIKRIK
ncbi:MAG: DGQHR domain-containing protein [Candidatus Gracilibacteria bacterium]|nr:DGQHR domain-containing protein [Candidatus Gracilibacteria bacterium]